MSCDATALADVRQMFIFINPGTHYIDNIHVE